MGVAWGSTPKTREGPLKRSPPAGPFVPPVSRVPVSRESSSRLRTVFFDSVTLFRPGPPTGLGAGGVTNDRLILSPLLFHDEPHQWGPVVTFDPTSRGTQRSGTLAVEGLIPGTSTRPTGGMSAKDPKIRCHERVRVRVKGSPLMSLPMTGVIVPCRRRDRPFSQPQNKNSEGE